MASADQLKALVKSHISRDDNQFYSVAMQVAAHEAKAGHGKLAEELRDMIDAAKNSRRHRWRGTDHHDEKHRGFGQLEQENCQWKPRD